MTNAYASRRSAHCEQTESWFESKLLELFEEARKEGIRQHDIAVIAATAIAVILTKPETYKVAAPAKPLGCKKPEQVRNDAGAFSNSRDLVLVQNQGKRGVRRRLNA